MASEARRNLVRIVMNYARLVLTLCLGIVFVRLIFRAVGTDGFGLIGLLGSATGISSMFQMVVQRSMIRELGRAHHAQDERVFIGTYNSALVLTWLATLLSSLLFGVMYLLLPWFSITDEFRSAAGWFLLAAACQTAGTIALSAPMNMYLVKERMAAYNAWLVIDRACFTASAAAILYVLPNEDAGRSVVTYGFITAGLILLAHLIAVTAIILGDRRLRPRLSAVNLTDIKSVLGVGGWNTGVVASLNLHHHANNLIMNLAFGLFGNVVFTIAMRLTGYVRMLATGMTVGLDAVSARISSDDENLGRLTRLLYHATRMHGLATFPATCAMCLLADPALRLWIGSSLKDPDTVIPAAVIVTWAMGVGITIHAIADGWITVLYGAGHIRRYAPLVILGGVANPVVAVLLLALLPEHLRLIGPALGYSLIMIVLHFIMLPIVTARIVGVRTRDIYLPLLGPLAATVFASPVILASLWLVGEWTLPWLAAALAGYGALYAALSFMMVLNANERRRVIAAVRRSIKKPAGTGDQAVVKPPDPADGQTPRINE